MGLFSKRSVPEPEPVRPEQVKRLINAERQLDDAAMLVFPGAPTELERDYERAEATRVAVHRNSTSAEIQAAMDQKRPNR